MKKKILFSALGITLMAFGVLFARQNSSQSSNHLLLANVEALSAGGEVDDWRSGYITSGTFVQVGNDFYYIACCVKRDGQSCNFGKIGCIEL